ncbi:MAG TPA: DUF6152 family protein [Bryobacteraceae bacterium]|jgi:hypothetical protein
MKKLKLLFSVGACLLGAWIPLSAHHSFQAEYDDAKPINLTGHVTKVSPDNPHGWIYMEVPNDKGRIIAWAVELPPPNVLQRNGFSTSVYKAMEDAHEEITVQAFLAKDGSKHAWAAGLTRGDGKTVITLGGLPAQPYNSKPTSDRKVKP